MPRPSLRRPYAVLASPVARVAGDPGGPAAIAFVSDPEARSEADLELLRHVYRLTTAEARLAGRMAAGDSTEEAAARLGVSRSTIRSQLKQLFRKTGARRQGELVRLLLTSTPPVR